MSTVTKFLEVRVHGIGRHDYLDALGTPPTVAIRVGGVEAADPSSLRGDDKAYVAGAPIIPVHPLRLVNWSRTTRSSTGLLWYLAVPFTLCNVSGVMASRNGFWRWAVLASTHIVGLVLSVLTTAWLGAIFETILIHIPVSTNFSMSLPNLGSRNIVEVGASIVPAIGLVVALTFRQRWREGRSKVSESLFLIHSAAILVTGLSLGLAGPPDRSELSWIPAVGQEPGPASILVILSVLAITLSSVFGIVLWAGDFFTEERLPPRPADSSSAADRSPKVASNRVGAAFALSLSIALLSSLGALLRAGLDGLLVIVTVLITGNPSVSNKTALNFQESTYLPNREHLNLIPIFSFSALIVFVVVGGATAGYLWITRPVALGATPSLTPRQRRARSRAEFVHTTVCSLGKILLAALPTTTLIVAALFLIFYYNRTAFLEGVPGELVSVLLGILALLASLLIFLRWPAVLANAVAMTADVVGFWKVEHHPLAGVSYRSAVMSVIANAVLAPDVKRVALVGHSQGSVLCAWFLSRSPEEMELEENVKPEIVAAMGSAELQFDLVTCGSPLRSLYSCFFPDWFDANLLRKVEEHSNWKNFWRITDPIATQVGLASCCNEELPDPGSDALVHPTDSMLIDLPPQEGIRAHGDYWIEKKQYDYLAMLEDVGPEPSFSRVPSEIYTSSV